MPGVRLPQSKEEISRLSEELMEIARAHEGGSEYKEYPSRPRRKGLRESGPTPEEVIKDWLEELSTLGSLYEADLMERAGRETHFWPEPLNTLDPRLVVRAIIRRAWARPAPGGT